MRDFYKKQVAVLLFFSLYLVRISNNIQMLWYFVHIICLQFKTSFYSWYSVLSTVSIYFFYFLLVDSRDLCYRDNLTICFPITQLVTGKCWSPASKHKGSFLSCYWQNGYKFWILHQNIGRIQIFTKLSVVKSIRNINKIISVLVTATGKSLIRILKNNCSEEGMMTSWFNPMFLLDQFHLCDHLSSFNWAMALIY